MSEPRSHLRLAISGETFPISQHEANVVRLLAALAGVKENQIGEFLPKKKTETPTRQERDEAHTKLLELYGIKQ